MIKVLAKKTNQNFKYDYIKFDTDVHTSEQMIGLMNWKDFECIVVDQDDITQEGVLVSDYAEYKKTLPAQVDNNFTKSF